MSERDPARISPSLERNPELDAWIRIEPDGTVRLFTGKVELGQGVTTAIARIGAEELDVSIDRVRVHAADTARGPNEFFTTGSGSLKQSGNAMRQAAAEARQYLLELASRALGAPVGRLVVEDGTVRAPGSDRSTSYAELLGGKRFDRRVTGEATPKRPEAYRIVGKPGVRVDLAEKLAGGAFVQDLELDGLLYGRVARPPGRGATLVSLDTAAVESMPGVVAVVRDGSFLGVVSEREEQAIAARDALLDGARWEAGPPLPEPDGVHRRLREAPSRDFPVIDGTACDEPVPPLAPPPPGTTTLEATYERPHQMHASLGPAAAVARFHDGALTVWSATQGASVVRIALAQALGLDAKAVRVVHVAGPGCYGHNGADDAALDAALLAMAVPDRPVRLQWMREDEHVWEPYGPAMVMQLRGSLDARGRVVDWSHDVWSNTHLGRAIPLGEHSNFVAAWHRDPPMPPPAPRPLLAFHAGIHRNADPLYAFPARRIVKHLVDEAPLRTSSTRGLGAFANVFAIESFMDELALAAECDPLEFRLRHLEDPRAREVLEVAAERAGWRAPAADGRGQGLAFARYENIKCYCAVVVDLEVDADTGAIRLVRAVVSGDAGQVVDPDGLANQLEGGFVHAASWTLKEEVRFDARGIISRDWETYPILTFAEVPEIDTVLLDRPGKRYLGSGEGSQGPTPAAIANAIFHATGKRLRRIPFTPERVLA